MFGLDSTLAHLGTGGGIVLALLVALLLGLRHATDPDHLTAVSTLVMSHGGDGVVRAGRLGLAWGAGHATTLIAFGLPAVLVRRYLPAAVEHAAELGIGVVVIALAARLLVRWRGGRVHTHPHRHGDRWHSHPHAHLEKAARGHRHDAHAHRHAEALGRSPAAAFSIGLLHGLGGSAAVAILLIGAIPDRAAAAVALVLFATATAVSMGILSVAFGRALGGRVARRRAAAVTPAFGIFGVLFGVWYALAALQAVPYFS